MPNWKIHIEISKRLRKKLNYNDEDYELFLFGSIAPDINNGYLVKDVSKVIDHKITHFSEKNIYSYKNFLEKYKDQIKDPFVFGYFTHLVSDFVFNGSFYEHLRKGELQCNNHDELRIIKQHDFRVFNNNFQKNDITITNIEKILESTKKISEISIEKDDVIKSENFLKEERIFEEAYQFYTEEELENIKEKTINLIETNYID